MLRRTFLKSTSAALLTGMTRDLWAEDIAIKKKLDWSNGMKPLYCLAYIDPENKNHKNQEEFISKYPISVIPQDNRPRYISFKQRLRELNNTQKIFGYMMLIDENGLRGPAHELVRKVNNSWLTLPGGIVPTKDIPSGNIKKRRLYDPRSAEFRSRFVEACQLLVDQHDFDGIFLDNCTIYGRFASIPVLGDDLLEGLQQLITEIRTALPETILIGNTRYNFTGLNGEMNEGRPNELVKEAKPIPGQVQPYINMFHYYMKGSSKKDLLFAENYFRLALQNKCFFGTGINPQTIRWYEFFDRVLAEYEIV